MNPDTNPGQLRPDAQGILGLGLPGLLGAHPSVSPQAPPPRMVGPRGSPYLPPTPPPPTSPFMGYNQVNRMRMPLGPPPPHAPTLRLFDPVAGVNMPLSHPPLIPNTMLPPPNFQPPQAPVRIPPSVPPIRLGPGISTSILGPPPQLPSPGLNSRLQLQTMASNTSPMVIISTASQTAGAPPPLWGPERQEKRSEDMSTQFRLSDMNSKNLAGARISRGDGGRCERFEPQTSYPPSSRVSNNSRDYASRRDLDSLEQRQATDKGQRSSSWNRRSDRSGEYRTRPDPERSRYNRETERGPDRDRKLEPSRGRERERESHRERESRSHSRSRRDYQGSRSDRYMDRRDDASREVRGRRGYPGSSGDNVGDRGRSRRENSDGLSYDSRGRKRERDSSGSRLLDNKRSRHSSPGDRGDNSQDLKYVPSTGREASPVDIPPAWIRCSPADLHFYRCPQTGNMIATKRMKDLEDTFQREIVDRSKEVIRSRPEVVLPPRPPMKSHHHHHENEDSSSSSSESEEGEEEEEEEGAEDWGLQQMKWKQQHPYCTHPELWFNDPGEMNDGPACRCSLKSRRAGIRHSIFAGEEPLPACVPDSNNADKLFHYVITMSPHTNFLTKLPTIIDYDNHEYIFEGFSLLSHYKLENVPNCSVIRFNISYTIHFIEEDLPQNYSIRSIDLFTHFLFTEILELVDINWKGPGGESHCNRFHLMPRFARSLPENGKELLSMSEVLSYMLRSNRPLFTQEELPDLLKYEKADWQNVVDEVNSMIVTRPGMKPSSVRVDQLDKQQIDPDVINFPLIIHFGIRPAQLGYAGDPVYQKNWKQYVKFKHLLNSKPKITATDRIKLEQKEQFLQELRFKSNNKREVTVELSSEGFIRTGIKSDITQHALLLPVLLSHLRFHKSLHVLEENIKYEFKDKALLQLALTHTSYKVNFGTNPDHARNSLSNCGRRQLEYGDSRIHYTHTRKRGINILLSIMAKTGHEKEVQSEIPHNERLEFLGDAVVEFIARLEFLGDAVVEFIASIHLYYMFPSLEEGGLTSYRAALVQNQHLAVLAKKLCLQDYMLYAHGPDLCHESDLKHAMANCFEALMGALYMDGDIELADRIFSFTLFGDDLDLLQVWNHLPLHPLQEEEPNGDRKWIESSPILMKLLAFEDSTGITFNHIRLLARAFTLRSVGYTQLTMGHNQRLEFLGDTVLQLITSQFLFRHFPDHHEGHLSLLRSSLVNNRTQSVVCDDLNMQAYVIFAETRGEKLDMKQKEKADVLEAFLGALYVDKGLEHCRTFCEVCFFPRLTEFILNQDWNDPKSQLQQCCLTLREVDGREPDIPVYKMIQAFGPTNTRKYTVAVYFRDERLATGEGHSIQQAEMDAAKNALYERSELFPILVHQKRFIEQRKRKKHLYGGKPRQSPGIGSQRDERGRSEPRGRTDVKGRSEARGGGSHGDKDSPKPSNSASSRDRGELQLEEKPSNS